MTTPQSNNPRQQIDPRKLSHRVIEARQAMKLSQRELEELAGLGEGSVGRIERGERMPLLETVVALAVALKIPVNMLLDIGQQTSKTHLPGLRPYLRSKYAELTPEAIEELDRHFIHLAEKHGVTGFGPKPGEDEFDDI